MNSMGRDGLWMSTAVMTSFFVCVQFFFPGWLLLCADFIFGSFCVVGVFSYSKGAGNIRR